MEPTDVIRLYLDDDTEPFRTARPPLRFQFTTLHLADGPHKLRIEAHNGLAGASVREIPFHVRNGVAITVSGIEPGQEIAGQVGIIINAYAGNTEVDFEPQRAETPQPIPTWAWLVFLVVIAWTMFYVLNPNVRPAPGEAPAATESLGHRVFVDTCAKCHQEQGTGLANVPALEDNELVLDERPLDQLKYVLAAGVGRPEADPSRTKMRMPEFGPRLTNAEVVAAINFTRTNFGNQAPTLSPRAVRAPEHIRTFEKAFAEALQAGDLRGIADAYSGRTGHADTVPARLVRPHDGIDVEGNAEVVAHWKAWLDGVKQVNSVRIAQAAYHVNDPLNDPARRALLLGPSRVRTPDEEDENSKRLQADTWIYAHGTLEMSVVSKDGTSVEHSGRFIRYYALEGPDGGGWKLALDFSTIPMPLGCEPQATPDEECPPGASAEGFHFQDVLRLLAGLGQKAAGSRHGNFWETLSYEEFVDFSFPVDGLPDSRGQPLPPGSTMRLLTSRNGAESNLVKALRSGDDVVVDVPGAANPVRVNIPRQPPGGRYMAYDDIARIKDWIDRGAPKEAPAAPPPAPPPSDGSSSGVDPGSALPSPGDGSGLPSEPGVSPPGDPSTSASDWGPDDVDYAGVQELFRKLKPKAKSAPHRDFWEKPYAEFVAFEFAMRSEDVKIRMIEPDVPGSETNLVKALRSGKGLVGTAEDGSKKEVEVDQMPSNGKPMPEEDIRKIERWIDRKMPEKRP
jgi:mono/diheme cytochrome c family protein